MSFGSDKNDIAAAVKVICAAYMFELLYYFELNANIHHRWNRTGAQPTISLYNSAVELKTFQLNSNDSVVLVEKNEMTFLRSTCFRVFLHIQIHI